MRKLNAKERILITDKWPETEAEIKRLMADPKPSFYESQHIRYLLELAQEKRRLKL